MKIAVLGSNGFIGSSITKHFTRKHFVVPYFRKNINLLDINEVTRELNKNKFDIIINAAACMTNANSIEDTRNNLTIFMNFFNRSNLFGKYINLGTGAEFDRSQSIDYVEEEDVFNIVPIDSYGYGQNIKSRLSYEKDNFFGLKIFNCFGSGEKETRVFPTILRGGTFQVIDRYFDFFFIDDLLKVIDHHIDGDISFKDMNCVYDEKTKVSEVTNMFCEANSLGTKIVIEKESSLNYTGCSKKLKSLNFKLIGLKDSLGRYVK